MKNFIEVWNTCVDAEQTVQVSAIEKFYARYDDDSKSSVTRIWFSNGYIDVRESYQEVKDRIAKAMSAQ